MEVRASPCECPITNDWLVSTRTAMEQVAKMHNSMSVILEGVACLECLKDISLTLKEVKSELLDSATGRDQIPKATAESLFDRYERTGKTVYRILGMVIFILLLVIAFLLTGEKFGIIGELH